MSKSIAFDRVLFKCSSFFADPFCWGLEGIYRWISPLESKLFNNYSTIPQEVAYRLLSTGAFFMGAYGLLKTAPLWTLIVLTGAGISCKVARITARILQKNNYTYVRGNFPEKQNLSELKVMSWNLLGFAGGLHFSCGGTRHWRDRIQGIVNEIQKEKPDVLVLQEVFDTAFCEALIANLQSEFAHFYLHLGVSNWGISSGCMVLTKCLVTQFSSAAFLDNDWRIGRCFAVMEIGKSQQQYRIVGTHLHSGYQVMDQNKRRKQFQQILSYLSTLPKIPTLVVGDLNIGRDDKEGDFLKECLVHGYTGPEETCTNMLDKRWKPCIIHDHETVDYISLVKNTGDLKAKDPHLVKAFDKTYNTKTALSDHHGIVVTYTPNNSSNTP